MLTQFNEATKRDDKPTFDLMAHMGELVRQKAELRPKIVALQSERTDACNVVEQVRSANWKDLTEHLCGSEKEAAAAKVREAEIKKTYLVNKLTNLEAQEKSLLEEMQTVAFALSPRVAIENQAEPKAQAGSAPKA